MEYLTIGIIIKTQGLKGEVKVHSTTDFALQRYQTGNKVFLFNPKDNTRQEVSVFHYRHLNGIDYVTFEDLRDINLVEKYVGYQIQVIKDQKDIGKDDYFYSDLTECDIYDENNNFIGKVYQIETYAAYITLRVKRENAKDALIPFVKAFILNVDIDAKRITIKMMKGLID